MQAGRLEQQGRQTTQCGQSMAVQLLALVLEELSKPKETVDVGGLKFLGQVA